MTHPLLPTPLDAVYAATWGVEAHSASSPEGVVRHAQLEMAPVPQLAPSGIARSQSLHMLQRFLNVPATPSFVGSAGGVVLDRVCTAFGGANWWGTLTGRLRAQSVWNKPSTREGKPHRALRDPSAYALSGRLRASVPYGRTTLRAWAELDSLEGYIPTGARDSLSADAQGPHSAEGQGSKKHPLRLRLSAHASKLIPGHDVSAEGSMSERAASSLALDASSTTPGYLTLGKQASLAVTSKPGLTGPLSYRAGLFASAKGLADGSGREEVSVRAQAAAALGAHAKFLHREKIKPGAGPARLPYSPLKQTARLTLGGVVGLAGAVPVGQERAAGAGEAAGPSRPAAGGFSEPNGGRAFASAGAVLQLGRFVRPLMDFTSLALRLDGNYGTASLGGVSVSAAGSGEPAGRSAGGLPRPWPWGPSGQLHVTGSACQQLYGPVRARADLRVLFEPRKKPALVETVYGVDVALTQLFGSARVVCWYSPMRQEAMAELRLLEG